MVTESLVFDYCTPLLQQLNTRGGRINLNINNIETNAGIGIEFILE